MHLLVVLNQWKFIEVHSIIGNSLDGGYIASRVGRTPARRTVCGDTFCLKEIASNRADCMIK